MIDRKRANMHRYYLYTDSGQYDEFEAENVADALDMIDVPPNVRSAEEFRAWLERVGGYGAITEDDVIIVEVKS